METPVKAVPGARVRLRECETRYSGPLQKTSPEVQDRLQVSLGQMRDLQERLYAEGRQALLIVLQALDAGGKDGTIRHVMSGLNPQACHVTSFKVPTPDELARDFLWRVHRHVPPKGAIAVFNRSHYEDVLVARVRGLVPEAVWRRRYEEINCFEKLLHDNGTRVLKFFLHISADEQKSRLQARLDDPTKHWKFAPGDLDDRARWDDYMAAYEDAINHCSTDWAPWHIVPADRKWYRNMVVAELVAATLQEMDPQWPPPAVDLSGYRIV